MSQESFPETVWLWLKILVVAAILFFWLVSTSTNALTQNPISVLRSPVACIYFSTNPTTWGAVSAVRHEGGQCE
jgi:hypothetical protein